jgi:hypothetical protein
MGSHKREESSRRSSSLVEVDARMLFVLIWTSNKCSSRDAVLDSLCPAE